MTKPTLPLAAAVSALAAAALLLALAPAADAQPTGLYSVEGTVADPASDPVAGAEVALVPRNDSGGERTTETDEDGRYAFENLSEGTYDLVADAGCCGPDHAQVTLSGTTFSEEADLSLTNQTPPRANDTAILWGRTVDHDEGGPVGGVLIQGHAIYVAEARDTAPDGDGSSPSPAPREEETVAVRSDDDGTYALELPARHVSVEARKDGYDVSKADLDLGADRRADVPLRPSQTPAARLEGTLVDDDGDAVAGADLRARLDRDACEDGACRLEDPPDDASAERDGIRWHVEPAASRYDFTSSGSEGRWHLSLHPGPLRVEANHPGHLPDEARLEVEGGETREVDLTLTAIPPASVRVHGTITDASDGEPVSPARVEISNQRWGTRNATVTDEDGAYSLLVRPGHAVVTVQAGGEGRVCVGHHSTSASATAGDDEPSREEARSVAVEPCPEDRRTPDDRYLPRHHTVELEADGEAKISPTLRPAPDRSATIQGWVLNASDGEEIPRVTVTVRNEVTGRTGWSTTDGNGSFSVDVTPGYYTVRAPQRQHADDHYRTVENVAVGPNETRTMALNLTTGTPPNRCCVVYGAHPVAEPAGPSSGADADAAQGPPRPPIEETEAGGGAFQGSGGDLGPYDPAKLGSSAGSSGSGNGTPGLAAPLATVAAALAATLCRRP
jgi:protocatechuate 3,4-dioxygenase beta subunit